MNYEQQKFFLKIRNSLLPFDVSLNLKYSENRW